MDLMTIGGLIIGASLLTFAALGKESADTFADSLSVLITIGGALSATAISVTSDELKKAGKVFLNAVTATPQSPTDLIRTLVSFGEIARRDGILALEGALEGVDDDFLVRGIQMAVDGSDPDLIYNTMSTELEHMEDRHGDGKKFFDLMTKYCPAFGMIGTLVGLVILLKNLDDPDKIGPSMAIALITTLYGAVMANLVTNPIADKLATRSKEESLMKQIIISGVMSIQSGDNPKIVEQKLRIYLPPDQRDLTRGQAGAGA